MELNATGARRSLFSLRGHRRVGLFSFVCLVIGGSWVASAILPGLQKASEKEAPSIVQGNTGWFKILSFFGAKPEAQTVPKASPSVKPDNSPAVGSVEATFVDAPVGIALQLLLLSGRFGAMVDSTVSGTVSYSCKGTPKPFWEVIGRVIGAAPSPGIHVAQMWDSYRIMPRNVDPMVRPISPVPDVSPSPVPVGEAQVTHRMAGFVSLAPNTGQPKFQVALLETRIPGEPPHWRMVRIGDTLMRKSAEATAQETNVSGNIDIAPVITAIDAHSVTLSGGGNKSLTIPLSSSGVPDIFGFAPGQSVSDDTPSSYPARGEQPMQPGRWRHEMDN